MNEKSLNHFKGLHVWHTHTEECLDITYTIKVIYTLTWEKFADEEY